MTSIALFGTSADPPHRGHAAVLTWLAERFDHVAVWTANNPFKPQQTELSHRFRMLDLLVSDVAAPPGRVQVHPELSHLRSIVSIERAKQHWPEARLSLVIGSDLVAQLPTWYRAEDIFAAVDLLIVPRPGHPCDAAGLEFLRQRTGVTVAHLPNPVDTASSDYRQTCDDLALTPAVQAYLDQHHLYPCPENSRKTLIPSSQNLP
ncbi:nicotinate-nicotinamide nucleotide adenylyltransferase [Leptolyngbya sp. BL0902]|uniref:nicotinate-nucleotide adenylyltransferase n=1 Tax=Leptolyngbya sp. BL0902 TaxID=1115757 RepID=UPI0018E76FA3|nr:nicotinate-nucleotide adenylyltransferase [Leptolyngbya sp. BL0902]QQE66839.1 nicotinate-nicotinamide nucleotide adenylyltransferase [Leptolyngbya sp. BL0902]